MVVYGQWLWGLYLSQYFGCFVFLAFGVFMFAVSFVKDMKRKLIKMNEMAKHKKSRKQMCPKLSKFIYLHARAKQLS